jgi:hypothetical protein
MQRRALRLQAGPHSPALRKSRQTFRRCRRHQRRAQLRKQSRRGDPRSHNRRRQDRYGRARTVGRREGNRSQYRTKPRAWARARQLGPWCRQMHPAGLRHLYKLKPKRRTWSKRVRPFRSRAPLAGRNRRRSPRRRRCPARQCQALPARFRRRLLSPRPAWRRSVRRPTLDQPLQCRRPTQPRPGGVFRGRRIADKGAALIRPRRLT